ncbi:MAG: substrate-binding domain-containing protein [Anaerolineae bacterium]|nr:substrate-binding domain-containing protein [Anaerolineae bacterium]
MTIGLVADDIVMVGGQNTLRGVADAARERDVNLLYFHQRVFQGDDQTPMEVGPASWDALAEVVDGLVFYQSWPSEETFAAFRSRFPFLPMVNALRLYTGCPSLAPDSYRGTKELTCHLVEAHGYRRIAFVAGPEGNWVVEKRYHGYVDALAEHGLPLDPNLITPHLDWEGGHEAVHLLLDERGLLPGTDFEAVVTSNDTLALGVLDELRSRGARVPDEVAIVGFDDDRRAACSTPSLTTTRAPLYEIGRQAVDLVLAQIAGQPVPERTLVPTKMMVRRSCGCQVLAVVQAATGPVLPASKGVGLGDVFETQRARMLSDMVEAIGDDDPDGAVAGWAEQVLSGFAAEMEGGAPGMFLAALEDVLGQVIAAGRDPATGPEQRVAAWQGAVSALQRRMLPYLDGDTGTQAEGLWQQARVMIAVMMEQAQARQALQVEQQAAALREVSQVLITTFDVGELMDALAGGLPRLDIPSAYLSLYEDSQPYTYPEPAPEWSRLMLAYDEAAEKGPKRVDLAADEQRFPSRQLVPEGVLPGRRYSFVVEPLYFQQHQLGFALFEVGPREGTVYDVLRGEISSALQGALLLREREQAEEALERAYAEVERQVEQRTIELQREIEERERAQEESLHLQQEVIEAQRRAIQELSTPIIPVLEDAIVMPLIGSIDTLRARDVTRNLLAGIREHRARVVILDITGVPIVDSGVAAYLNKSIQAARLKGARTIVTGISDAVAETIVDLGIDWSGIETLSDLRVGLRAVMAGLKKRE